jgi:hypothetical protein
MAIELTTASIQQLSAINYALQLPFLKNIYPEGAFKIAFAGASPTTIITGSIFDCTSLWFIQQIEVSSGITTITNASVLSSLEDIGTAVAVNASNGSLGTEAIDQFFTDLPVTTKTATINVAGASGAATCDPSIAQAKGYTVVTS